MYLIKTNKMIKKYGIKTKSGKWYCVEDHSHLFQHPTWFMFSQGKTFHILGLRLGENNDPKNIFARDIKYIQNFIGKHVMYFHHFVGDESVWGRSVNQTSRITEVIEFQ